MKSIILFFLLLLVSSNSYSQDCPKTDTVFSVKYKYYSILNSKMNLILKDIESKCQTPMNNIKFEDLSDNSVFSILLILKEFNQFAKTNIFMDYKYIICSEFCYKCEQFDHIKLIEFHYTDKSKAELFKSKFEIISKDKEFFNYPVDKLFYYKVLENNVCYLLMSTQGNPNNEIFYELKNKIEKLQ